MICVFWQRGLRGPDPVILVGRKSLNEHELKNKIAGPFEVSREDEELPLATLARLYPIPGSSEARFKEIEAKLRAMADDPAASENERRIAREKLAKGKFTQNA